MDSSGSINWLDRGNYDRMKTFVNQILDYEQFDIDSGLTRVGLLYFSDSPLVEFRLEDYSRKSQVEAAVLGTPYLGQRTGTAEALEEVRTQIFSKFGDHGDRLNVANAIIILTDGESTSAQGAAVTKAQSLRLEDNINIFTVGITNNIQLDEIQGMSGLAGTSTPGQENVNYFLSPTFTFNQQLVDSIASSLCSQVVIPPVTPPPPTFPPTLPPGLGPVAGEHLIWFICQIASNSIYVIILDYSYTIL